MNKILLYLAFIFSISPAYAEWVKYSTTDDSEIEIYLDPNTIRRNGNSVLIWTLQDFKKVRNGDLSMKLPITIQEIARRKLRMLHRSENLIDLTIPPSNHLEKLKGYLSGYYSIRINNRWRIIFIWSNENAEEVEIIDYH